MAKLIYICSKNNLLSNTKDRLYKICAQLEPDNLICREPEVNVENLNAYGIMNPSDTLRIDEGNIVMGEIFGDDKGWKEPLNDFPDGSFALIRNNNNYCELVSDAVGSRTIWYYHDKNNLIASTSQRAIIMFLGSFVFNQKVIPWMLSSGSLGPDFSWDKRIKRVPANSSVLLDKKDWTLSQKSNPIVFKIVKNSSKKHRHNLEKAIKSTFESLKLDLTKWVLPLSGGFDSRAILYYFLKEDQNAGNVKTITWGLKSSQTKKGNDAKVAKELANKLNVENKYYHTDISDEPIETIVNRFILLGEGRIDQLAGYMDGFHIWKTLFEDGIQGIIRGDEGFGWTSVSSPYTVRLYTGLCLCEDFSNLANYKQLGIPNQEIPSYLKKLNSESLETWRDRIYHQYRIPTILAALSDLKLSYVEQVNPLLSQKILEVVRELPDNHRTEKSLFRKIVLALRPKVEFAISGANAAPGDILASKSFVELLKKELSSEYAQTLFSEDFLSPILNNLVVQNQSTNPNSKSTYLKLKLKRLIPAFLKNYLMTNMSMKLGNNVLAFRVFIVVYMHQNLSKNG